MLHLVTSLRWIRLGRSASLGLAGLLRVGLVLGLVLGLTAAGCTSQVGGPGDETGDLDLPPVDTDSAGNDCGLVVCEPLAGASSGESASSAQAALRSLGETCTADAECARELVCRPMGTTIDADERCLEPGVEYISKRFQGPTHLCGDLCDSDADCADAHSCRYLEASENGMCIADGDPIIDLPYGDKTADCAHPE